MTSLTIELPNDTYRQLLDLARARGVSLDALIQELGAVALAGQATERRFRAMASKGNPEGAGEVLDRLDRSDRKAS